MLKLIDKTKLNVAVYLRLSKQVKRLIEDVLYYFAMLEVSISLCYECFPTNGHKPYF